MFAIRTLQKHLRSLSWLFVFKNVEICSQNISDSSMILIRGYEYTSSSWRGASSKQALSTYELNVKIDGLFEGLPRGLSNTNTG